MTGSSQSSSGKGPTGGNPFLVSQHLLASGAHAFSDAAGLEQTAIELWQEDLRTADIKRIGHRHHAAHSALEKRGSDGGKCVLGLLVEGGGLTGVQNHRRQRVLMQQGTQIARRLGIGSRVLVLEYQATLSCPELMRRSGASVTVGPVPVKMQDMVVARALAQVLAKLVEGRRTENV